MPLLRSGLAGARDRCRGKVLGVPESKVNGKTLQADHRQPGRLDIEAARAEANRLRGLVDQKTDPRDLERQRAEAAELARVEAQAKAEAEAKRKPHGR